MMQLLSRWLLGPGMAAGLLFGWSPEDALASSSTEEIGWSSLVDQAAQIYEDPYRDLNYEQLQQLVTVARQRALLDGQDLDAEDRAKAEGRLSTATQALEADGVDIDGLIAQRWAVAERRRKAATAGNAALDGENVRIAGYVIPAPVDADGNPVVYLVPERGMCSHMPPPPPNQMIRVRVAGDWQPRMIYEPVRLTGTLALDASAERMMVVDGIVAMEASYRLDATDVEVLIAPAAASRQKSFLPKAATQAAK